MSTKISALPASTGLVLTDIFPVVDDPGGVPVTQKATFTQLQTLFSAGLVASFNTRVGAVTLTLADVSAVADARYVLKAGDTMTGALSIGNGVVAVSTPTLNLTQTWNAGAVTFTNLFSNVTNTASSTNSNLFNFQVDGVDRFNFTVGGVFRTVKQDATDSGLSVFLRKRGAVGDANAAISAAGTLGSISFSGWDGAAFATGNQITSYSEGAWTGANHGNSLDFYVVPTGSIVQNIPLTLSGLGVRVRASLAVPYVATAIAYLATALDFTIDCTSGTFTVSLPTAVGITGRIYVIKNSGVGTITIDPSGAQTIDGLATSPVVSGAAAQIQSTGANWIII